MSTTEDVPAIEDDGEEVGGQEGEEDQSEGDDNKQTEQEKPTPTKNNMKKLLEIKP